MSKWGLRGLALWLLIVVCSIAIGTTASIGGYANLSEIMGMIFLGSFGGAIFAFFIALAIVIWQASNTYS